MSPRTVLLALVPPICWGAGFAIAKPAVEHFPPLFMMAMIYAVVSAVLLAAAREPVKTPWPAMIGITALAVPIQGVFIFLGLRYLPASVATLVLQIQVPFAVLMGWLVGGETLDARKIAGTFVAIAGVAMVVGLLMPVVGIGVAAVLLGERIEPAQLAGGAVILAGLAIVTGAGPLKTRSSPG